MITINSLQLDDNTSYLVDEVTYKGAPARDNQAAKIAYRSGIKRVKSEWSSKVLTIKGWIFSSTATGLQTLVDTFQQNLAVEDVSISFDAGRTYTATLDSLDIPSQFYNNTALQYTANFIAYDPFAYAASLSVSGTVISGTITYSGTVTISGSVYAEPTISILPTGASAGNSGISSLAVGYSPTGESVTASGTINYTSTMGYNYHNFQLTNSGIVSDYSGIFSRWQPGVNAFTITTSGVHQKYNWVITYQPRYYE